MHDLPEPTPSSYCADHRDSTVGSTRSGQAIGRGTPSQEAERCGPSLLHTPAEAADILAIKESWLRRHAGQRKIPCTFVGKHLRFSDADLHAIVQAGSQSARPAARRSRQQRPHLPRPPREV